MLRAQSYNSSLLLAASRKTVNKKVLHVVSMLIQLLCD